MSGGGRLGWPVVWGYAEHAYVQAQLGCACAHQLEAGDGPRVAALLLDAREHLVAQLGELAVGEGRGAQDLADDPEGWHQVLARRLDRDRHGLATTTDADGETVPWNVTAESVVVITAPTDSRTAVIVPVTEIEPAKLSPALLAGE